MRVVTGIAAAALVLAVPAAGVGERDLVATLADGGIAYISAAGEVAETVVGPAAPGTPVAIGPVWSPDGTRVAFAQGGIVVAGRDGTLRRLTTAPSDGFDVEPAWSWDGTEIVFRRHSGQAQDLQVVPAAGGPIRALTRDGATKSRPRWQPHGTTILFQTTQAGAGTYVVDSSGGTARRVGGAGAAEWAPDGTAIARGGADGLEVFAPDGTGRRVLANVNVTDVAWAWDGRRLAFTVATPFARYGSGRFGIPIRYDVFAVDRDGTDLTRLTGFEEDTPFDRPATTSPRWWPGGSRLFFRNAAETWTMNADGSCEQRYAADLQLTDTPAWSPTAAAAAAVACSAAQLRLHVLPAEVGVHDDVTLSVVLRNDGTRALDGTRLEIAATHGEIAPAGGAATCTSGRVAVCTVGTLARGAERRYTLLGSPGGQVGLVRYTARVAWDGPPDVTPAADLASAAATVAPCDILGTWGNDRLSGTPRRDRICGRPGADRIDGGAGNDVIDAGSGADTVIGGPGRDEISGGGGGDVVYVRDGRRDVVDCGAEQDAVVADGLDALAHCERVTRTKLPR